MSEVVLLTNPIIKQRNKYGKCESVTWLVKDWTNRIWFAAEAGFFASSSVWGPSDLLSNEKRELYPGRYNSWGVKLRSLLNLLPRLRTCGALPPFFLYVFMT